MTITKMSLISKPSSIFGILIICFVLSCHIKKDIVFKDEKFKTSFKIYENFYGSNRIFPTDTIVTYQATFLADDNYDSYKWTVDGDPTIHVTKSFRLLFPFSETGNTLIVTLAASKNGRIDTVSKKFTLMAAKGTPNANLSPYSVTLPYFGTFEGSYEDEPTHKFKVTITDFGMGPDPNAADFFGGFRLINLPEGCGGNNVSGQPCHVNEVSPYHYSYSFDYSYEAFFVHDVGGLIGCCPPVAFYGYMDSIDKRKLIIECNFLDNSHPFYQVDTIARKKFIGYKL